MLVSFVGSLPLGVQNLTAVKLTLEKNLRAAVTFAAACASVEIIYSYIAVKLTQVLLRNDMLRLVFQGASIVLFLVVGILYLIRKPSLQAAAGRRSPFALGLAISLPNMAAIPFWLFYSTFLSGNGWIEIGYEAGLAAFVLGIPFGTVLALSLYAALSEQINRRFSLQQLPVNKIIGVVLIGLGLYGAVRMALGL